jgi:hypothetical protein
VFSRNTHQNNKAYNCSLKIDLVSILIKFLFKFGNNDSFSYRIKSQIAQYTNSKTFNRFFPFLRRQLLKFYFIENYVSQKQWSPKQINLENCSYTSFSQSGQDVMAELTRAFCEVESEPIYLELGSGDPVCGSNSYLLEKQFYWKGISVELNPKLVSQFKEIRSNECINANALIVNYDYIITNSFSTNHINYLSLDIDPAINSLKVLHQILTLSELRIDFITFEHDAYRSWKLIPAISRYLLKKSGYICLKMNVRARGYGVYEDWWVNKIQTSKGDLHKLRKTADFIEAFFWIDTE